MSIIHRLSSQVKLLAFWKLLVIFFSTATGHIDLRKACKNRKSYNMVLPSKSKAKEVEVDVSNVFFIPPFFT